MRSRFSGSQPPGRSPPGQSSSSSWTGALRHPPGLADRGHRALGRARSDRFSHRPTGEEARERLLLTDEDRDLGEALDRRELSLYQSDPFASEQLRGSLTGALGAAWWTVCRIASAAALLGETPRERAFAVLDRLRPPRRATQPRRRESLSAGRLSKCSEALDRAGARDRARRTLRLRPEAAWRGSSPSPRSAHSRPSLVTDT